jgi:broad specificity phosphatase PhoE
VPADEPADEPLPDLAGWLGRRGRIVTSPALRCRVAGTPVDPRLRPWDLGCWTGRPFHELDLAAWRNDASYDGHGGESLIALSVRLGQLLDDWHDQTGRVAAITHAAVIKAMVVHALRAPVDAVWDVDVAPGSLTELHVAAVGWRLVRVNCCA